MMPERGTASGVGELAKSKKGLALPPREVHLWYLELDGSPGSVQRWASVLSDEELRRASRFRFEADRARFIAAHGMMREILSRYTGGQPRSLKFRTTGNGKPVLAGDRAPGDLTFNLAHASRAGLLGVTLGARIGVDIEQIDPELVVEGDSVLTPAERSLLATLADPQRAALFTRWWTRKEAVVKALGEGLSFPVSSLDVRGGEEGGTPLEREICCDAVTWSLIDTDAPPGHKAAVAVEGGPWRVIHHAFRELM